MGKTISGLEYHLQAVPWTHFGTLTLRVVPPAWILNKCVFEYLRRIIKRFCIGNDFNWSTSWIVRYEYGERTGRLHVHFLFISDKPLSNVITQCQIMKHMWQVETAGRWVNRLNKEQRNHNVKLRQKYHFKSQAQFEQDHGDQLRVVTRNDFSSPGFADIRVYEHQRDGVAYIMKGLDIPLSGANRYELAKFNDITRDDVTLMASHRLLFDLFNKSGDTGYSARARFQKSLVSSSQTGRNNPRHDGEKRVPRPHRDIHPADSSRKYLRQRSGVKTPNRSSQLWDPKPDYQVEAWSWSDSQF